MATAALALVLGAAAVAGCGDDDDVTLSPCAATTIEALNTLDLTDIEVVDGLDDDEFALLDERFAAVRAEYPDVAPGGDCEDLTAEEFDQVANDVRPEVLSTLEAYAVDAPGPLPGTDDE